MYMNQNNPQINFEEENEREQLLRMEKLRKLVQQLLLRHLFLFGLLFLLILLLLSALLVVRNKRSATRFTAELELLYQPKESSYYKPIDDHAMLQLFGRNTTFSSTTEELARTRAAGRLTNDNIEIHQKRNQNRLFQILASANTEKDAILKANTFARVCMEQYRAFRLADLANWMDAIQQQKKRLEQSIRENAEQAVRLAREVGLTDPASELERLRQHISEQKQTLSELVIRQANMAMRKQKLSLLISHLDPNALRNAAKIKEQLKDLKETDDEVLVQSQLYTDSNPKLLALKARREAMRKAYDDFLRRVAEEKAQQQKAHGDADGLGGDGEEDAPENAEDQRVRRREDDGGREAQRVDEEREQEAEEHGPGAERLDVERRLLDVAAREQSREMRQERRIREMDDEEERGDGERRRRLDHPHGFFLPEVQSASILSSVCPIISFLAWRIHGLCGKIK